MQKAAFVMVHQCYFIGGLHVCKGTSDAKVYIGILETHITHQGNNFSQEVTDFPSSRCLWAHILLIEANSMKQPACVNSGEQDALI